MKERLRKMLLEMLNRQFKASTFGSTELNLHMIEVMLAEDLFSVFTGIDSDEDNYDEFHDEICSFVYHMHKKYNC